MKSWLQSMQTMMHAGVRPLDDLFGNSLLRDLMAVPGAGAHGAEPGLIRCRPWQPGIRPAHGVICKAALLLSSPAVSTGVSRSRTPVRPTWRSR